MRRHAVAAGVIDEGEFWYQPHQPRSSHGRSSPTARRPLSHPIVTRAGDGPGMAEPSSGLITRSLTLELHLLASQLWSHGANSVSDVLCLFLGQLQPAQVRGLLRADRGPALAPVTRELRPWPDDAATCSQYHGYIADQRRSVPRYPAVARQGAGNALLATVLGHYSGFGSRHSPPNGARRITTLLRLRAASAPTSVPVRSDSTGLVPGSDGPESPRDGPTYGGGDPG